MKNQPRTYAAVMAKTSLLFAFVKPRRQSETMILKPAMMASRASIDLAQYKIIIEETGSNEARMLVTQYVIRSSLLSE